jgi:hypothetical protein
MKHDLAVSDSMSEDLFSRRPVGSIFLVDWYYREPIRLVCIPAEIIADFSHISNYVPRSDLSTKPLFEINNLQNVSEGYEILKTHVWHLDDLPYRVDP